MLVYAGASVWDAERITATERPGGFFDFVGPDYYFVTVGAVMGILGLILLFHGSNDAPKEPDEAPTVLHRYRHLALVSALVVYAVAIPFVGYFLATAPFLLICLLIFGVPSWWAAVALSAGFTLAVYWGLGIIAGMSLPRGVLFGA
jgi:hypothetical protein